jgi:enoyl-CoA hydratase/carnithine racemase
LTYHTLKIERDDAVLIIGLNRPDKRNAFDLTMLGELATVYGDYDAEGRPSAFPAAGWGNAMRWMLTAEDFNAEEARRIGIVQEIVPDGAHLARATELARTIAQQAPLAVRATLANARLASRAGADAAEHELGPTARRVLASDDARIGLEAFRTRTTARYLGR